MAEENKKPGENNQKTSFIWKLVPVRTKNRIKNWSNKRLGTSFHETQPEEQPITILDVYEQMQEELNFEDIRDLNHFLIEVENKWDGGTITTNATSADAYKNEVRELYRKLGHFCDIKALEKEHSLVGDGVPSSEYKSEEITIKLHELGETTLNFSVPKDQEIKFNHGLSYKVAYFGSENKAVVDSLNKPFQNYFSSLLESVAKSKLSDDEKKKMESVIKKYRRTSELCIEAIEKSLKTFEALHRSFMSDLSTIKGAYGPLLEKVKSRRLEPKWVQYRHTYRIINVQSQEKLKTLKTFWKEPEEIEWGLDENGWPLEVAEKDYVYVTQDLKGNIKEENIPTGTILLDVFNNKPRRRAVPDNVEYTEYCDLLDMSAWVYVNYDAFRDDLRDGRYHNNSLSIMEYLLKRVPLEYLKFNHSKLDNQKITNTTDHTTVKMDLNNPPNRPRSVDVTIKPTHINPAFDLRRDFKFRSKRDIHLGRKLYYDLQENMFDEQSKNPTMTTRGAALWILARVIERAKYWDETIKLLEDIGGKIDGYDIGPNIQFYLERDSKGGTTVQPKRWGERLTKNPFKPISGAKW